MLTQLMLRRRSVRKYLTDIPPEQWLTDVVACGQTAPSPSNTQPVRIRQIASLKSRNELQTALVRQRDLLLNRLAAENGPKRVRNHIRVYYRYSQFMFTAPWLLLVGTADAAPGFRDKLSAAGLRPAASKESRDIDISVGLFVNAMLLRAAELGLGSCVLTAPLTFLEAEKELEVFRDVTPKCFVTLGYSAETPKMPKRLLLSEIMERL